PSVTPRRRALLRHGRSTSSHEDLSTGGVGAEPSERRAGEARIVLCFSSFRAHRPYSCIRRQRYPQAFEFWAWMGTGLTPTTSTPPRAGIPAPLTTAVQARCRGPLQSGARCRRLAPRRPSRSPSPGSELRGRGGGDRVVSSTLHPSDSGSRPASPRPRSLEGGGSAIVWPRSRAMALPKIGGHEGARRRSSDPSPCLPGG